MSALPPSRGSTAATPVAELDLDQLLQRSRDGDTEALNQFLCQLEARLRRIVHGAKRRAAPACHTTEVFSDAYVKMFGAGMPTVNDTNHFIAMWVRATRWALYELWRRDKRAVATGPFAEAIACCNELEVRPDEIGELFDDLRQHKPNDALITELKYLSGLSTNDIAELLDIDPRSVRRRAMSGRLWLETLIRQRTD